MHCSRQVSLRSSLLGGAIALATIPAALHAQAVPLPQKAIGVRSAVNISSGMLTWISEDISVGPEDSPAALKLVRMHNIGTWGTWGFSTAPFGIFTTHNFEANIRCLAEECNVSPGYTINATVVYDHKSYAFGGTVPADGRVISANADGAYLTRVVDKGLNYLAMIAPDGTRVLFGQTPAGYNHTIMGYDAALILHPNGERTKLTYQLLGQTPNQGFPPQRLASVENSRGYGLRFSYLATGGTAGVRHYLASRVDAYKRPCAGCAATDVAAASYGHKYIGYSGYALSSYTDPAGATETYSTDSAANLLAVNKASGRASIKDIAYTGGAAGQGHYAASVTDAAGRITRFPERTVPLSSYPYAAVVGRDVVNTDGTVETYMFDTPTWQQLEARRAALAHAWPQYQYAPGDTGNRIASYRDALGRTVTYELDYFRRVKKKTSPEGDAITYKLDERGNSTETVQVPKPGSPLAPLVTTTSYPACTGANFRICNKPAYIIDPKGFRTNYVWSTDHGGLISETSGLNSAGVCAIPGGCPSKSYEYSAHTGLDGAVFYLTSAEIEQISASQSTRTTYGYDPAAGFTLKDVLADVGGLNLRTCLKYDSVGNMVRKDEPKAGLASCS